MSQFTNSIVMVILILAEAGGPLPAFALRIKLVQPFSTAGKPNLVARVPHLLEDLKLWNREMVSFKMYAE